MKKAAALLLALVLCFIILTPSFCASPQKQDPFAFEKPVYSDACVLLSLCDDARTVLLQKNAEKKKYPASLTKIVTAMVVLESGKSLQSKATVSQAVIKAIQNTGAQNVGLKAGQRVSLEQLLNLSLIFSACDASRVLAEAIGGTTAKFVKMMNTWARAAGCQNTHFVNPDGLHHKNQYSTASDLTLIALKALENKDFVRISTTESYRFAGRVYPHTNHALNKSYKQYYYPYMQGIKTGYTKQAGRCLITTAQRGSYRYLAVLLDAPLNIKKNKSGKVISQNNLMYTDAKNLFNWAFESWSMRTIIDSSQTLVKMNVEDGKKAFVGLCAAKPVKLLVPNALSSADITVKLQQPRRLTAPVRKGETVCRATLLCGERELGEITLITAERVRSSAFKKLCRALSCFA